MFFKHSPDGFTGLVSTILKDPRVKQVLDHSGGFGDLLQKIRADADGAVRLFSSGYRDGLPGQLSTNTVDLMRCSLGISHVEDEVKKVAHKALGPEICSIDDGVHLGTIQGGFPAKSGDEAGSILRKSEDLEDVVKKIGHKAFRAKISFLEMNGDWVGPSHVVELELG